MYVDLVRVLEKYKFWLESEIEICEINLDDIADTIRRPET